jgi:hypothetical protein
MKAAYTTNVSDILSHLQFPLSCLLATIQRVTRTQQPHLPLLLQDLLV